MLSALLVGIVWSGLAAIGGPGRTPLFPRDYELVASVDNMGIPLVNAGNLLKQGGVKDFVLHGSLAYGVSVAKSQVPLARRLLREDAWARPYLYLRVDGVKTRLGVPDAKTWTVRRFDLSLAQIADSPAFKRDGNLRGLAKRAVAELARLSGKRDEAALRASAVVRKMKLFDMQYLGDDGKLHWGYRAEVTVSSAIEPSFSGTASVYAWDDGRQTACHGSW